mmetsp:Transcript_27449/g.79121  ORF Transcript_27449/g.79121 Transcript_27449/m.79121 type:complete len:188 (+) Transcript_27449:392-955(+)
MTSGSSGGSEAKARPLRSREIPSMEKKSILADQRDSEIQSIQSSLANIENVGSAELEVINSEEKRELEKERSRHEQALAARQLELTRAGVDEKEGEEDLARERRRTEPTLLLEEKATKERYQQRRAAVLLRNSKAKENADAAITSLQNRFDTATTAPEREFRRQALRWIETSKRRLLVLDSKKKRRK